MSSNETKVYRQTKFARPPGATEILLVRHGESRPFTPGEDFPLVDGHGDPELSEIGRRQAIAVGERLRSEPVDAIYVTNLRRTVETAAPLIDHVGLEPRIEPDLREVHLGEWEGGKLRIMAAQNDPIYQRMHAEERWDVIPGAESRETLQTRVASALKRIAQQHPDEMVVAFVHGGIVGHILAHAAQARPFAFNGADNGSISHIVMMEERTVIRRFNDVSHLVGLETDNAMT